MERELAIKLQDDGISYRTQVEIQVTTADFHFALETRPLLVFVDRRVHLGSAQMAKDDELRTLRAEERISNLRITLRQLPGQEKRPAVRRNPERPR